MVKKTVDIKGNRDKVKSGGRYYLSKESDIIDGVAEIGGGSYYNRQQNESVGIENSSGKRQIIGAVAAWDY